MNKQIILTNTNQVDKKSLLSRPHGRILDFKEVLTDLISPDSGRELSYKSDQSCLTDGEYSYPIKQNTPILYPNDILEPFLGDGLELKYYTEAKLQYFLLSQIKQRGEINAASTSIHYQRHLYRLKEFMKSFSGKVLDVGCDDVEIGASLVDSESTYVGIDPFSSYGDNFKVVATGECLPFRDGTFDMVLFNTSLDHILDYHTAIDEAYRVLKPGGVIVICSIVWTKRATLLTDSVHFHHFREFEIIGALSNGGEVVDEARYSYKDDEHRYGLYIASRKTQALHGNSY